jgi:O-antigen ligase
VTLLTVVGAMVLLCESMRARRRIAVLSSGAVLLAAPVSGQQRASYAVAAVIVIGLLAAVVGRTWRSRSTVRPLDLLLSASALVLVAVGLSLAGVVGSPASVVSERLDAAFVGEGEAASAAARITIAQAALSEIAARPVFGWGLGHRVMIRPHESTTTKTLAAHNVVLDVSLRAGLVGLVLLVAAASKTVLVGVRRWRFEPSPVAAVCLGATLGIVAVFAKAMLEPALEWYRLSSLLGICCGLVLIAGRRPVLPGEAGAGYGRPVSSLDAGGLR